MKFKLESSIAIKSTSNFTKVFSLLQLDLTGMKNLFYVNIWQEDPLNYATFELNLAYDV